MEPSRIHVRATHPRRSTVCLIVVCLAFAAVAGCHGRRSAMRPRWGGAGLFNRGCPSGDCGTSNVRILESSPGGFSDPGALTAPPVPFGSDEFGEPAPSEPEILPPARERPPTTPPRSGSEPSLDPRTPGRDSRYDGLPPEAADEPETRLRPRGSSTPSTRESYPVPATRSEGAFETGPSLEPPRSASRPGQRINATARRPTLRRDLEARVNDPGDLFTPPRADRPWRYIVLHHSAHPTGGLDEIDRDHRERLGTTGCGYHFVIGNGTNTPDGRIEVAQRWSEQKGGQHCRDSRVADINEYGIGICLIGDLDDQSPSAAQVESTRALIAYLKERYNIPDGNVVTHDVVAKSATACPGRHFPTAALLGRERPLARQTSYRGF